MLDYKKLVDEWEDVVLSVWKRVKLFGSHVVHFSWYKDKVFRNHKIRWKNVAALVLLLISIVTVFEWEYIEHLFVAMGIEVTIAHLLVTAIRVKSEVV